MKITKEEYINFKKQHNLKNEKISEICKVSKSTANGWSQLKSDKSIPKLAMSVLFNHVVLGIKLQEPLEASTDLEQIVELRESFDSILDRIKSMRQQESIMDRVIESVEE